MKFCGKCGSQLADDDIFCTKCGKPCDTNVPANNVPGAGVIQNQVPQNTPLIIAGVPQPGPGEAMLVVTCNSINPKGCVTILNGKGQNVVIPNGGQNAMKVAVGNMVIRYQVDRGPGLTMFAARKNEYSKSLFFHSGETIIMQVNIGREINNTNFQSSLGFVIA